MSQLINAYKKMSAPMKASFWFAISNVLQKGISLLSTPIFTRLLTTEQYGVYSVYQSWYSIISVFATLNLYAGVYNNGMTKWPDKRPQYTSALLGLSTTITICLFFVYLVAHDFWNNLFGLSSLFVVAMFIEALFGVAFNFWSASQRYDYKYRYLVAISIFIAVASPIVGIIAVLSTDYKAEARVLSYVGVQVVIGLILYIYIMYRGKKPFNKKYWLYALSFNIPLIPHYLSQTVLNNSDRIMIANMVGSGEAAIYSVAYSISMMFTIVTNAINNSFIPYTYKAIKDKKYENLKSNASLLVLFIALVCIVAMAFGPEIIRIFAAPQYYEARWIVPPVATALLFMFIYPLFCNIEFYFEQNKFVTVASSVAAVANIVLNFIFIGIFGYIAAAYTTLICYMLLSIAHYCAYRSVCKKQEITEDLYDLKLIVGLAFISLLMMAFMLLIYDLTIVRLAVVFAIAVFGVINRKKVIEVIQEIRSH